MRRTALDNYTRPGVDPACPVCLGTGVDLVFETECTECWSRRDANVRDARDRIAANWERRREPQRAPAAPAATIPARLCPRTGLPFPKASDRRR